MPGMRLPGQLLQKQRPGSSWKPLSGVYMMSRYWLLGKGFLHLHAFMLRQIMDGAFQLIRECRSWQSQLKHIYQLASLCEGLGR